VDLASENARLRALVQQLQDHIDALERQLGQRLVLPACLRLTATEQRILARLMVSENATKDQLLDAVIDSRLEQDAPEMKIVDVYICKLRKKLVPWSLEITTLWGIGYALPPASRDRLRHLIAAESVEVAA
jgi:two-component system cell cycle response regulator CtrA